jgi:hypothetical protein
MIVFGVVGMVATVALIAASQPSNDAETAGADGEAPSRSELVASARPAAATTTTRMASKTSAPPPSNATSPTVPVETARSESPVVAPGTAPVTITGCLAQVDDGFWLTDTAGADVPRERSWKSGFLKKHPSRVELVHASSRLGLSSHIGHRVAATGPLTNREMQVQSLVRLGGSCG